jgi:hypothetical protein
MVTHTEESLTIMKIQFHNPNYSLTTISAKSLQIAINKYIHLYNRNVKKPYQINSQNFNIPYTIINHK